MVLKTEHDLAQYLPRESNDINLDQLKYSDATYYPDLKSIEAPEYTPPGAARAYQQGMINFRQEQYEPCAIMMRKSLELAMKDLYPGGTGVLAKRIKDAANAGLLTKDMAEWAGEIKVIGNESVHGDMYTPMEDAEDVKDFTELFLTYAFTLPYRLFERREKRAAK